MCNLLRALLSHMTAEIFTTVTRPKMARVQKMKNGSVPRGLNRVVIGTSFQKSDSMTEEIKQAFRKVEGSSTPYT
jgi:hypothetical protein